MIIWMHDRSYDLLANEGEIKTRGHQTYANKKRIKGPFIHDHPPEMTHIANLPVRFPHTKWWIPLNKAGDRRGPK